MNKSVLIVEDEHIIAADLAFILHANGWQVLGPVSNVKAALELLEHETPAVAVLDVNLGRELVTPVAERLKATGTPFAIASAYNQPELIGGDVLAGAPNAGKPTSERKLLSVLESLVGT